MQDLQRLNFLIDKASAMYGSDNQLAIAMGTTRQVISNWRHGHKSPSTEMQQKLAELAGIDPAPHVLAAAVEKTGNAAAIALVQQLIAPFRKAWHFS
ncbi:helix-turn-helix transcriptional regulator [Variovorax sp.]|uniref:helix-turn-helix domain-containing protein n=1 Tax=Variovorax sp. TaxID=1871043 RepID=UPI0013842E65|nr:helix-turn-helix transcriptional regulator [Variovorax sp.]KAF1056808.1 MAG: hypothetical protein GAK39_06496 [Variovorax sp.]